MNQSSNPGLSVSAQRQAAASTVTHTGPTVERYQSALQRYLSAVGGAATQSPDPTTPMLPMPRALVADVMQYGVVSAHKDAGFKQLIEALASNRISAVPVVDSDRRVVGVVSESDLITHIAAGSAMPPRSHRLASHIQSRHKGRAVTAGELMTTPAVTTTPYTTVVDAARQAARARVRRLPVIDAEGTLLGIVTRADLLRVFLREDADIRGEIEDYVQKDLLIDPAVLAVEVRDGIVTLAGQLERKLTAIALAQHVREISGVIDVHDHLTGRVDDSILPAPLTR